MKKVIVLLLAVLGFAGALSSCSLEDPNVNFNAGFLPVVDVDVPEYMQAGATYPFKLYYKRPTNCYYYNGFYSEQNGNDFQVAVSCIVLYEDCQPIQDIEPEVATFEFQCPQSSFQEFTFHFYTGQNASGEDQYMDVTVPVEP